MPNPKGRFDSPALWAFLARMAGSPEDKQLVADLHSAAVAAYRNAYAPYSEFYAGAAVRGGSGRIFGGCNVENASLGATICAERNAVSAAIAAGERNITHVFVVVSADSPVPPCGICRQFLAEFGGDIPVFLSTDGADAQDAVRRSLDELLPGREILSHFLEKGRSQPV